MLRAVSAGDPAGLSRLRRLLSPSLGGLLWRNSKADVADQLGLPPQHTLTTHLHMSAVERYFYGRCEQGVGDSGAGSQGWVRVDRSCCTC